MGHGGTRSNIRTVETIRDSAAARVPDEDQRLADIIKLVKEAPVCGSPDCCQGVVQCFDLEVIKSEEAAPSPWEDASTAKV